MIRAALAFGFVFYVSWIAASLTIDALVDRCWWPGTEFACAPLPAAAALPDDEGV